MSVFVQQQVQALDPGVNQSLLKPLVCVLLELTEYLEFHPVSIIYVTDTYVQSKNLGSIYGGIVAGLVAVVGLLLVVLWKRKTLFAANRDGFDWPKIDEWEYNPALVKLGVQIGEGAFGVVMAASVTDIQDDLPGPTDVAVKVCPPDATLADKRDFVAECDVIKQFSRPWHPNVCHSHSSSALELSLLSCFWNAGY